MTRFEREISGQLGEFWAEHAAKEVDKAVEQADNDAMVDEDGAIFWKCNGRYLMDDFCEKLEYAGYVFSREATAVKRDEQNSEFIKQYKAMQTEPSEDELAEMRATFGEGTVVVNLLTGREIRL